MKTIVFSLCLAMMFSSCRNNKCKVEPEILNIPVNVEFIQLEHHLSRFKSKQEAVQFLNDFPEFSYTFLERHQYPHDSILGDKLYKLANDPHIDTLFMESNEVFGDMEDLKAEFTLAFKHIKKHYPGFQEPRIYTAITGFGNDLFVSDSMIVIGLDYFLGDGATFRPNELPNYMLSRYRKEYIVPSVVLLMSNKYNVTDYQNNTMLADMIYFGKAYYFTKTMMPCTADSLLIGYTGQELRDVYENEQIIWANFIENELLYETNHFMKSKFMGERPKIFEIGAKCPGRIGAWLGWEIVDRYMSKNRISLIELMQNKDVNDIFAKSKYRPRK